MAALHRARGGGVYLLTVTVRHGLGDELKPMRTGVAQAWRKVQSGAPWLRFASRFGVRGMIRALEVTHGANGFHPHLHTLVLTTEPLSSDELAEARGVLSVRWQRAVGRTLPASAIPDDVHGCDLRPCTSAEYLTKLGLAFELLAPTGKVGRGDSCSMFQIAAEYAATGCARAGAVWREYAKGIRGARMLTWTRGLRASAGLDEDTTDADLLEATSADEVTLVMIPAGVWQRIRDVPGLCVDLIEAAESSGAEGVHAVIAQAERRSRFVPRVRSG